MINGVKIMTAKMSPNMITTLDIISAGLSTSISQAVGTISPDARPEYTRAGSIGDKLDGRTVRALINRGAVREGAPRFVGGFHIRALVATSVLEAAHGEALAMNGDRAAEWERQVMLPDDDRVEEPAAIRAGSRVADSLRARGWVVTEITDDAPTETLDIDRIDVGIGDHITIRYEDGSARAIGWVLDTNHSDDDLSIFVDGASETPPGDSEYGEWVTVRSGQRWTVEVTAATEIAAREDAEYADFDLTEGTTVLNVTMAELITLASIIQAAQQNAPILVKEPEETWHGRIVAVQATNAYAPFTAGKVVIVKNGDQQLFPIMEVMEWADNFGLNRESTTEEPLTYLVINPDVAALTSTRIAIEPNADAVAFFLAHGGTITDTDGSQRAAKMLARAEKWAKIVGAEYTWAPDWEVQDHAKEYGEAYADMPNGNPSTCEVASMIIGGTEVGALGCIDDADDNYRRVVQAELAADVMPS
jgi:hypothetical protein